MNKANKNKKITLGLIGLILVFSAFGTFGYKFLKGGESNLATTSAASNGKADLNSDGNVNIQDLSILISQWGKSNNIADISGDNVVNINDLSILLSNWGVATSQKPGAHNTGVPAGQTLTVPVTDANKGITVAPNGNVTITKSGTFTNMLIKGRLILSSTADNIVIRYSRIEANPNPWDLPAEPNSSAECNATGNRDQQAITAYNTHTSLLLEDSEIEAVRPSTYIANGIHGYNMTIRRVDISKTVDGIGIFRSGGAANTVVENSYIHDLYVGEFVYAHGCDEATHTDGIQVHYGSNIRIVNNTISPNSITPLKSTSAIMVNQNGGKITSDLWINNNWLDYGACSVNVNRNVSAGLPAIAGLKINSNKYGKNQTMIISGEKCALIVDNQTKALSGNEFNGNVWEDSSLPNPTVRSGG